MRIKEVDFLSSFSWGLLHTDAFFSKCSPATLCVYYASTLFSDAIKDYSVWAAYVCEK